MKIRLILRNDRKKQKKQESNFGNDSKSKNIKGRNVKYYDASLIRVSIHKQKICHSTFVRFQIVVAASKIKPKPR